MCIPPRETTRQPPIIVNFDTEEFYWNLLTYGSLG
jgi:hypothetical protein